jgi:hypothetical protein
MMVFMAIVWIRIRIAGGKSRAKVLERDLAIENREAPFPGLLQ